MTDDLSAGYPHFGERTPDWRFRRAMYRRDHRRRAKQGIDDAWCRWAYLFLVNRLRAGVRRMLQQAYTIWYDNGQTRWLLEAQLLTDRTTEEIAVRCGVSHAVVVAYEQLFFDVRTMANAHDWLVRQAVGSHPMNQFAGLQPAGLWKYMAYTGGRHVLDAVVAVSLGEPLPAPENGVPRSAEEEFLLRVKIQLSCTMLLAKSAEHCAQVLRRYQRLLRTTQASTSNLSLSLQALRLSVKGDQQKQKTQTPEDQATLRADAPKPKKTPTSDNPRKPHREPE